MKSYKSLLPTVLFASLALGAAPVGAQSHGGGGGFHGGGGGGVHGGGGVRNGGGGVRGGSVHNGGGGVRGGGGGVHGSGGGGFHRGGEVHNRGVGERHGGFNGNRGDGDHHQFHDGHFRHDFRHGFRFRPRFGVGFGIFLGYPFEYPFYDPWDYGRYPVGPLAFAPGQGYGGVSFAISPSDASVTVDGAVAGSVDQFNDPQNPLNLPPGQHHIQIQAPGYSTLDFEVNVEAGRVVPYAGDLQRQ